MSKTTRSKNVREGSLIAIPLRDNLWGVGLVARKASTGGVLLGYFFKRVYEGLPSSADISKVSTSEVILICLFGDLGIRNGAWKLICQLEDFDRFAWPMTRFARIDSVSGNVEYVTYSEEDLVTEITIERGEKHSELSLPRDGLYGYKAVEAVIRKLLL